jgi:hypothetical protein
MNSMKIRVFRIMFGIALILIGTGCAADRYLRIDPGQYTARDLGEVEPGHPPPWIQGLEVDRERSEVVIFLRKGSPLHLAFTTRKEDKWPAGCPGNLYSQRMEVIDLQVTAEQASALGLLDPILARDCPGTPYRLVLREDGELGGAVSACPGSVSCQFFLPAGSSR